MPMLCVVFFEILEVYVTTWMVRIRFFLMLHFPSVKVRKKREKERKGKEKKKMEMECW